MWTKINCYLVDNVYQVKFSSQIGNNFNWWDQKLHKYQLLSWIDYCYDELLSCHIISGGMNFQDAKKYQRTSGCIWKLNLIYIYINTQGAWREKWVKFSQQVTFYMNSLVHFCMCNVINISCCMKQQIHWAIYCEIILCNMDMTHETRAENGEKGGNIHGENDDVNNANAWMADESGLFQSQKSIWRISSSSFCVCGPCPSSFYHFFQFILIDTTRQGEYIYIAYI